MAVMVTPAPAVDWNAVFLGLRREGYTLYDVAGLTGIPRKTLHGWMGGAEPRHQDGETIIKFWTEALGLPRESVPLRRADDFTSWLAESRR